jgi:hypothetical protein
MHDAKSDDSLREICIEESDLIIEDGYTKPLSFISFSEKEGLAKTVKVHFCLLWCKAELDQLKCCLSTLGVGEAMHEHPEILAPFFIYSRATQLTADVYIYVMFN